MNCKYHETVDFVRTTSLKLLDPKSFTLSRILILIVISLPRLQFKNYRYWIGTTCLLEIE